MITITVQCPVCEEDIEVECDTEEGEWYGADADGNRGEWREGYVMPGESPEVCPNPECAHTFSAEEMKGINEHLEQKAKDYEPDNDGPDEEGY